MRTGERSGEVFDALLKRGEIVLHASDVERTAALARIGATPPERGSQLVITDTRDQVAALNAAIRDRRHGGHTESGSEPDKESGVHPAVRSGEIVREVITHRGERIGVGDRVATRRNDRDLDVANRDTWTVTGIRENGSLVLTGRAGDRDLPAEYVQKHVELAFTTTVYGAQGETVDAAHLALCETTGAAAAYVGMTRGRHLNVAHLVAESTDDARSLWVDVFTRDRADLGPGHAAQRAADDIDRYGPNEPAGLVGLQAAALRDGPIAHLDRSPGRRRCVAALIADYGLSHGPRPSAASDTPVLGWLSKMTGPRNGRCAAPELASTDMTRRIRRRLDERRHHGHSDRYPG